LQFNRRPKGDSVFLKTGIVTAAARLNNEYLSGNMSMARCANCTISLKSNAVIGGMGILKGGEEICQHCWHAILRLDTSKGPVLKHLSLEDVVYKLSGFKKSIHRKLLEAKLISGDSDRIVPGEQQSQVPANPDNEKNKQENCAHCLKSLQHNSVFLGLGKLKSGELVCEECWLFLCRLESSMSNRLKEFSLADVRKIFDVVHNRYIPEEQEATAEGGYELAVYDVSPTAVEMTETGDSVTDGVLPITAEITEPLTETMLPDPVTASSSLEARLSAIGVTRKSYPELWLVERLEEELETVLAEDEKPVAVIKGTYGKEHAALVATNLQFILLSKKTFGGAAAEAYDLDWIQAVEHTVTGGLADVSFSLSSTTLKLTDVEARRAVPFCESVKPLLNP